MQWIDQLNERVGRITAWGCTLLVILVFINVLLRYFFNTPLAWAKELEWHVFALLFLFGAAYSLRHNRHVRVDLFYDGFRKSDQASVNFWGTLLFLLPWCAVLIWTGWEAAEAARLDGERSPEAGGLPNFWLIKYALPLGMGLLFLQGLSLLRTSWQELRAEDQASQNEQTR
ncbi:MAG: TRAP transporter small permease subunit [Bacteroidetes bacterium]|nr:MAG: TRAP transporter small permease subunit [Bacteroidota bacterium]